MTHPAMNGRSPDHSRLGKFARAAGYKLSGYAACASYLATCLYCAAFGHRPEEQDLSVRTGAFIRYRCARCLERLDP